MKYVQSSNLSDNENLFYAYLIKSVFYLLKGQCKGCGPDGSKCAFMGPLSVFNPTRGDDGIKLFYETNWKPPYCRNFSLKQYELKLYT